MPVIPRSERQVTPSAAPLPYSGPDLSAPGRALQGVANSLGALAESVGQQEDFESKIKLTEFDAAERQRLDQESFQAQGDGKSFLPNWTQGYDQRAQQVLQGMSPRMQKRAQLHIAQRRGELGMVALNAQQRIQTEHSVNTADGHLARIAGQVGSPEDADKAMKYFETMLQGAPMPETARRTLMNKGAKYLVEAVRDKAAASGDIAMLERLDKMAGEAEASRGDGPKLGTRDGDGMAVLQSRSGAKFRVAADHQERFAGLLSDLEGLGVDVRADESGGYANRNIAGTGTKSQHAFGRAIDINWNDNARGAKGSIAKQLGDEKIRELAAKHGLKWGGDWKNRDDMHFEVDDSISPRPLAQRGITAGMNPKEGQPASLSAFKLEILHQRGAIQTAIAKERERQAAIAYTQGMLRGEIPFNPEDTEQRGLVTKYMNAMGVGQKIFQGEPEAVRLGVEISQATRFAAPDVAQGFVGLVRSGDEKKRTIGYDSILSIRDKAPHAFAHSGISGEVLQEADDHRALAAVLGAKEAITRMDEMKKPEFQAKQKLFAKEVKDVIKGGLESEFDESFDEDYLPWNDPSLAGSGIETKAVALAQFTRQFEYHYARHGAKNVAIKLAAEDMKRLYRVTKLGKAPGIMPYAPELFYDVERHRDAMRKDIITSIKTYYPDADPERFKLLSDARTAREARSGAPTYRIMVERKVGGYAYQFPTNLRWPEPGTMAKFGAASKAKFDERDTKAKSAKAANDAKPAKPELTTPSWRRQGE